MRKLLFLMLGLSMSTWVCGAAAFKIVRGEAAGANLIKADGWRAMKKGDAVEGLTIDNGTDARAQHGFTQTIVLNQTEPLPIEAIAWSKAQNVGGSHDPDYALYLDITYMDGQPLWGQSSPFKTGTHDWQKGRVTVIPTKPIKSVSFYLLFRNHTGQVQFRDAQLLEPRGGKGTGWLDGTAVMHPQKPTSGFMVRDLAADSDWEAFDQGAALGLKIEASQRTENGAQRITARLTDTSGKDRAVTLLYGVGVEAGDWQWDASPRRQVLARGPREYLDATSFSAGASGLISRYPLAAISSSRSGRAIAIDLGHPAYYRVAYSPGTNLLYIAYDIALTREHSSAEIGLCTYDFAPAGGFRGALAGLYRVYPEFFHSRTPHQGIWMPFGRISRVPHFEDFGFVFKEGNDETQWDDAHGILTFRYTEPMTWWMKMPPAMPRTMEAAMNEAKRLAGEGNRSAQALLTSGYRDESGNLTGRFRNEPWCDGIVWSMNSSPGIAGDVTDFKNKWNAQLREKLYGPQRKGDLDGEYIDSSEGYVTDELDFGREHFAAAPILTFGRDDLRPCVFRGLIATAYVRGLAQELHPMGKLTMANGTPNRLCLLAPWLDVMGTETDWDPSGRWRPMDDEAMLYRRALCGPKPYCFLMNTDFTKWTREKTLRYFERSLAYGMYAGFFSANAATNTYFSQPDLYERDRELFRKYVPLCRKVGQAGWQPLTRAVSSQPEVHVERFGENLFTLFNDSTIARKATIRFEGSFKSAHELVEDRSISIQEHELSLELGAQEVRVIEAAN